MHRKLILLALGATLTALAPRTAPLLASAAWAACAASEKPDKTTVEDIRKLLEKAGYTKAHKWTKGCDNVWHVIATKDGAEVGLAVLPDGHIVLEGG